MKEYIVKAGKLLDLSIAWTGEETKLSRKITLVGSGACVKLSILIFESPDANLNLDINVIHAADNTKSDVNICGLVGSFTRINAQGLIRIEEGAKGSDAKLNAKFLMLSSMANCNFTPSLEIFEQEVTASHTLTISQVDEIQMFYLTARGLSSSAAKNLISQGFILSFSKNVPVGDNYLEKHQ